MLKPILTTLCLFSLCLASDAPRNAENQVVSNIATHEVAPVKLPSDDKSPQRVIIMVGDGMGYDYISAAHVLNKGKLYMEQLPQCGMVKTESVRGVITDSAAAGTAFATGVKTLNGRLGVDKDGKALPSLFKLARQKGLGTGLVVTKTVTDATPAAYYAQVKSRNYTPLIAAQLLQADLSVIVGGGRTQFTKEQREELKKKTSLLAWLADGNAPWAAQRGPVLAEYTARALESMHSKHPEGFLLLVEGSLIDVAGHDNDAKVAMEETLDFDRAVGVAMRWAAAHPNTLVLVFADHSTGGLTLVQSEKESGRVRIRFVSDAHNGIYAPLLAGGTGSQLFSGCLDNTDIFKRISHLLQLSKSNDSF